MNKGKTSEIKNKIIALFTVINAFICVILFIGMIILASLYMIRSQSYKLNTNDDIPLDTLLILKQGGTAVPDTFDISFITPEFIGFNFPNGIIGITCNDEITRDVYLSASDYIKYIFGNNYICEKTISGEAEWKACLTGDNYIYIKYPASLPSDVIYTFFNSKSIAYNAGSSNDIVFIREMFLMFDYYGEDLYGIHAVTRDDNGNVAVFDYNYNNKEPRQYFKIDNILSYYGNSLFYGFEFAENNKSISNYTLPLNDTTIILNKNITAREISVTHRLGELFQGTPADSILKQFGYNPDKVIPYPDPDGTIVYVENHGVLRIQPDNTISYKATGDNGGIDISNYLSYGSYNGNYNIFEIIKATGIIIDSIRKTDNRLLGGDAGLRLYDMSYKDKCLTINYSYYLDNIIILNADSDIINACRFTVKNNKITEIYIKSISISNSAYKKMNYPELWMLDKIGRVIKSSSSGDMRLAYLLNTDEDGTYSTEWTYTARSDSVVYNNTDDKKGIYNNEVD
jgi:hypothetical protein